MHTFIVCGNRHFFILILAVDQILESVRSQFHVVSASWTSSRNVEIVGVCFFQSCLVCIRQIKVIIRHDCALEPQILECLLQWGGQSGLSTSLRKTETHTKCLFCFIISVFFSKFDLCFEPQSYWNIVSKDSLDHSFIRVQKLLRCHFKSFGHHKSQIDNGIIAVIV